jgi:hypothetical protein
MTERIHRCLDGELPRSLLSASEEAELDALTQAVEAAREYVASPRFPDMADQVMRALPVIEPKRTRADRLRARAHAALDWMWSPRTIVLRPAYGLAGAFAFVLALGATPDRRPESVAAATVAAGREAEAVYVQFRLDAPGARRVSLAGSFSAWEPRYELQEVRPGVWKAMVPVRPGVHDYLFVVDGERWVPDPVARPADDGFGGVNSRMYLAPPPAHT